MRYAIRVKVALKATIELREMLTCRLLSVFATKTLYDKLVRIQKKTYIRKNDNVCKNM